MSRARDDRRQHPRSEAALPIVLRVELHGFDASSTRFESVGRTRNLSHGGLLALVEHEVDPGGRLLAHFPDATGTLGRTIIFGTVGRCVRVGDHWEVAMVFDTPLVDLELPGEASA
jgi:hypothetical protein